MHIFCALNAESGQVSLDANKQTAPSSWLSITWVHIFIISTKMTISYKDGSKLGNFFSLLQILLKNAHECTLVKEAKNL